MLYSELLMESDRQRRDQASKVENVKPAVLQGRPSLKMKMPTFDGNILHWQDFWTIWTTPSDQAKALGVHWDMKMDTMHVSTPQVDVISTATKRQVASTVARIFDLMSWHAPAMIPAKIILQQLRKL